jgi:hypothetical protein
MDVSAILSMIPVQYLHYVTAAVAVCSALSAIIPAPTPAAPAWWARVYGAVNFVAINLGHAKNASAPISAGTFAQQPVAK